MRRPASNQTGLTLIELMISLLLGLMLLSGMLHLYLDSRRTDQHHQALAQLQESGRLALDLLTYEIRMAGSGSCPAAQHLANNLQATDLWPISVRPGLLGLDHQSRRDWKKMLPRVQAGSDALIISRVDTQQSIVVATPQIATSPDIVALSTAHSFTNGTPLLLQDKHCSQETLFVHLPSSRKESASTQLQVRTDVRTSGPMENCARILTGPFTCTGETAPPAAAAPDLFAGGTVSPVRISAFYLRPGSDGTTPGLYRRVLGGTTEELISGVEDLQLSYTLIRDNPPQQVRAAQIQDWSQVTRIDIELRLRSALPVAQSSATGRSPDGFLRQTFRRSVHLRNSPGDGTSS